MAIKPSRFLWHHFCNFIHGSGFIKNYSSGKEESIMESMQTDPERREFSRIDVYIPFEFRLVPEEEQRFVNSRISGEFILADFHQMPPLENQPQLAWVNLLNIKLDSIIQRLTLQYQGFHSLPFKYVTISGSGMNFSSQQSFSLGDLLEVKMMLTLYKPAAFYIYGEVVKVQKQTNGYLIAISFQMTDDIIRDQIIRFVFETERELLRERRKTE
jgi:hypothetical protein